MCRSRCHCRDSQCPECGRLESEALRHNRGVVLEWIADVAILVGLATSDCYAEPIGRTHGAVIDLVRISREAVRVDRALRLWSVAGCSRVGVPLVAVILPGNVMCQHGRQPMLGTDDGGIVNTVLAGPRSV